MRIVIWGAGAIGGTIGAYLSKAGHDIHFVDVVEEHVRAINDAGLQITGPVDEFNAKVKASLPHELEGNYQTIFLCTKSQHTEAATAAFASHLADDGFVLSVQNGLNELIIRDIVGSQRTMGAFINFSADYHAPGKILFGGRGAVVLGELDGQISERLRQLRDVFRAFDEDTIITDNLWAYLWGKEAYGAMLFVSALTDQSIADALSDIRYRELYIRAAQEILQLATATGVEARGFNGFEPKAFVADDRDGINQSLNTLVAFNRVSAKTHSGIWRDLAVRKRETEVIMYQPILAEGEKAGIALPVTRRWIEMIREIEDGTRPQALANLDELMKDLV